jgi:hypothetical protein
LRFCFFGKDRNAPNQKLAKPTDSKRLATADRIARPKKRSNLGLVVCILSQRKVIIFLTNLDEILHKKWQLFLGLRFLTILNHRKHRTIKKKQV